MENCLNKFVPHRTKWDDMVQHMVYEPYMPSHAICSRVCHIGGYRLHFVSPVLSRSVAKSVGGWTLRWWTACAVSVSPSETMGYTLR